MAISVVVAVDPVADELVPLVATRMAALRTGDGRRGCDMGPLVTGAHRDKVASYVDAGVEAGAELVVDGRAVVADGDAAGSCWARRSSTASRPACRSTTRRSSARCSRWCGPRRTTRRSRW